MRPIQVIFALAVVAVVVVLGSSTAQAETISAGEYRSRLASLQAALDAGDAGDRVRIAAALLDCRIASAPGSPSWAVDRSVLAPLARQHRVGENADLRLAAFRLTALLASLPAASFQASGAPAARNGETAKPAAPPVDPELLRRLTARQALPDLPKGGALPQLKDAGPLAALADFTAPFRQWLNDLWHRFWRWLRRAFTRSGAGEGAEIDLPRLVTALVIALVIVLAVLGLKALRRRRAPVVAASPKVAPTPAPRDDDPLSRRAQEWEAYARELTAAGRYREAVRAWYHAVLVALYQRGVLHHRKGRTNWEYVAAVPPEAVWRPAFMALTRRFEREWYGGDHSSAAACDGAVAEALELLAALGGRAGAEEAAA